MIRESIKIILLIIASTKYQTNHLEYEKEDLIEINFNIKLLLCK